VSFAAIRLSVASERAFVVVVVVVVVVISLSTQFGNFWAHPRININLNETACDVWTGLNWLRKVSSSGLL
jgi:hypothetical protein